jgi:hypothetical protein
VSNVGQTALAKYDVRLFELVYFGTFLYAIVAAVVTLFESRTTSTQLQINLATPSGIFSISVGLAILQFMRMYTHLHDFEQKQAKNDNHFANSFFGHTKACDITLRFWMCIFVVIGLKEFELIQGFIPVLKSLINNVIPSYFITNISEKYDPNIMRFPFLVACLFIILIAWDFNVFYNHKSYIANKSRIDRNFAEVHRSVMNFYYIGNEIEEKEFRRIHYFFTIKFIERCAGLIASVCLIYYISTGTHIFLYIWSFAIGSFTLMLFVGNVIDTDNVPSIKQIFEAIPKILRALFEWPFALIFVPLHLRLAKIVWLSRCWGCVVNGCRSIGGFLFAPPISTASSANLGIPLFPRAVPIFVGAAAAILTFVIPMVGLLLMIPSCAC